jgi:hypothetical protein
MRSIQTGAEREIGHQGVQTDRIRGLTVRMGNSDT